MQHGLGSSLFGSVRNKGKTQGIQLTVPWRHLQGHAGGKAGIWIS